EGLFVHSGDLWRLNTPISCLQPPQQGKTHINTVTIMRNYQKHLHCLMFVLQTLDSFMLSEAQ
ncbi:hypothetical protein, partial [Salmonella enterica]